MYICTADLDTNYLLFVGSGFVPISRDDDDPTVIIIVVCVMVIVLITSTIIIILVVYRIKRKKWPCTNKSKLFHIQ